MNLSQVDPAEIFSKTARVKPLFVEPSDECVREDPLTGPQGFMVGGMAKPNMFELSREYYIAAELLVDSIQRGDVLDYDIANPVLFLYRHAIELLLKSIIGGELRTHGLDALTSKFEEFTSKCYGQQVPPWIVRRIKEVAKIDPGSTAFRYTENWDKEQKRFVSVDGEVYVSLPHLQKSMKALYTALAGVATYPKS